MLTTQQPMKTYYVRTTKNNATFARYKMQGTSEAEIRDKLENNPNWQHILPTGVTIEAIYPYEVGQK